MSTAQPETVEDRTVEFLIVHSDGSAAPDMGPLVGQPFTRKHWRDAFDDVQADVRERIWAAKSELDSIDGAMYTQLRNSLFPLATSGRPTGQGFFNRAGHKLLESMEATGVWQTLIAQQRESRRRKRGRSGGSGGLASALAFADVCGGPGAFSQALFATAPRQKVNFRGFGLTLGGVDGLDWYPELTRKRNFTATYGVDGTGDVFQLANLDALATVVQGSNLLLVVADGGFTVSFDVANYQETISSRIMYGQWLAALKLLKQGGSFVLKLFDTFAPLTRAVLFLSTFLYDRVHIVKPRRSRVVNSERYLVCVGFRGFPTPAWMKHFDDCYTEGFVDNDHVPELIPATWMSSDEAFTRSICEMNATVARNQHIALNMVIRAAAERRATGDGPQAASGEKAGEVAASSAEEKRATDAEDTVHVTEGSGDEEAGRSAAQGQEEGAE